MVAGLAAAVETEEKMVDVKYEGGDVLEQECMTAVPAESAQQASAC